MKRINYSWVIPIYNESLSLPQLFREILNLRLKNCEIIAINDNSDDNSLIRLKSLKNQIPSLKIINFNSHLGKWAALRAGFNKASGEIIITSDSDLQDDPKEILKLLKKLSHGYDLISGNRKVRFDIFYKIWISRLGNILASILSGKNFKDLNSPFKVYRSDVLDDLPKMGSMLRFSLLFAHKLDYKVAEVDIAGRPRLYGKSKFGVIKYLRILYDLILIMLLFSGSGKIGKNK